LGNYEEEDQREHHWEGAVEQEKEKEGIEQPNF